MKMTKRIVALVLAVAMMISSLPTMVSASTSGPHLSGHTIGKYGENHTLKLEDDGTEWKALSSKTQIENIEWSISNSSEATAVGKQAVVIVDNLTDHSRGRGLDDLETKAKLEIYDAFEGQVTINAKLTYQKYNYNWGWEKQGSSYTVDMQPYTFTVSPDYTISLNVGESEKVSAIGSADWYDFEEINDGVYSFYEEDNIHISQHINLDKLYVKGEKPGVGYFYKDGANKYLYKVVVTGEEPQPEDPEPIDPVLPGILCGTYNVHPGDEFTLQKDNEDLKPSDITKDSDASNVPGVFTQKGNSAAEKFTYIVSDNAELKEYRIYLQGKGNDKDKKYYWIINVTARPAVELDVVYEGLDDLSELAVKEFDELDTVLDNALDAISTEITDYVEETYSENGIKYTLDTENSTVTVVSNAEEKEAVVTINAVYTSQAITYKNIVAITTNRQELTAETVKLESVSLELEDSTFNAEISKEVKDYVAEFPETEDAAYKLVRGNVSVTEDPSENGLTVTRHINVTATYDKTEKVTLIIKHRLSFVWNNVDELANNEAFKTETKKIKVTDIEEFVKKGYKNKIVEGYDWNGNALYNPQTKTLEILYKAKKVTITKTYNYQAQNETKTTYYNFEDLKDYDFDRMSKADFKAKFYNDDVVNKNNKVFNYVDSNVQANGTIANITVNYDLAKYTVTYMGPNGELGKETVKYGQNAVKSYDYARLVPGFKGWVNEEGKVASFFNIKANMTVTASQKDKVTIKHVLDWNGETQVIDHEDEAFKEDYAINYLKYALDGYVNPQIASIEANVVTIKYYAIKVEVRFVDKKGNEIADKETVLIPYARHIAGEVKGYDFAKEIYEAEETIRDDETYTTYTLDADKTTVKFYDNTIWSYIRQFAGANMAKITYKYDEAYDQTKLAINYVVRDPYYNSFYRRSSVGQYKESVNTKDFGKDKVQEIADAHIPAGYEKVGEVVDTKESGVDHWWTQEVRVTGKQQNKTLTYSVGKYWHLTKENGTYKRASDWSDKDWYRFPKEEITVVGKVPTYYGFKEKTVDGMTFNNSNVTWNPILTGDYVNGFYDNDGTKDGVVVGNYYLTNVDSNEVYATANLTFKLDGSSTAAFDGSKFVEYPNEDETKVIIWKEIKLENNQYNVYGVKTNTNRSADRESYEIRITQNLPLGMRNTTMDNVKKYLLNDISEKAAAAVQDKEGKERQADIDNGASVIKIEASDFYDLLAENGTIENNVISCAETITSNYYTYSVVVELVERDLTSEKFTRDWADPSFVRTQAINNAVDAVKGQREFSEVEIDKENSTVVDLLESGTYAAGDYELVVRLVTTDNGTSFEVKVPFTATRYSSGGGSGSGSNGTRIGDRPIAQGSELLNDLRLDRPNDLITRAEFVGVLANIFQVPEDRVYDKAWNLEECTQREQIERLATYFIVKGYSDEEFGQNDIITVEQMYTILTRALQFQQKVKAMTKEEIEAELAKANYTVQVSDWAQEGVSIALKVGIAAATETAPTEPQNGIMRITAADTLQKYIEVVAAPNAEAEVKVEE